MHSTFAVYARLGFDHIVAVGALDHILFIVALAAGYGLTHWRHLLVLVTAFTVGHSITLALATLRLVSISSAVVEILIPLTILATAIFNMVETGWGPPADASDATLPGRQQHVKYVMALVFGLIHGLGFSTVLRAMLGDEESIALPLFSFNVGLEVGQIAILTAVLVASAVLVRRTPMSGAWWTRLVSAATAVAAGVMVVQRLPF